MDKVFWLMPTRLSRLATRGSVLGASLLLASLLTTGVMAQQSVLPTKRIAFELPAADGSRIALPVEAEAVIVCFLGTECPLARQYAPRLQQLADTYRQRNVAVLGVDSNVQDSAAEVLRFCEANKIRFPIGLDHDQQVANLLGVDRTPEVVLLDRNRTVCYQGRIDDQYMPGVAKPQATAFELRDALDAVLRQEPVLVPKTTAVGCRIGKIRQALADAPVTYTGQIARVLNTHCIECHRLGEIGPFAMSDYAELRGWGEMLVEVIDQGRMPPWHAATGPAAEGHTQLRNARLMPETDKQLVRDWVAAGMPYGPAVDLPPIPEVKSVWHLPSPPDIEVAMRDRPFDVPAEGTLDYQYFVVDPGFTEDRWVAAAQVVPGNPGVVHHAIVFIRPPDGSDVRGVSWLTAYVPGQRHSPLPAGSARRVPAGSKLVFQMHYTPNGQSQSDVTRVGMVFADPASVEREVITLMAINQEFEIPPLAAAHPVNGELTRWPAGSQLLAISPHMHVRGKSFRVTAVREDQRQTLLDVPRYDFNWQHTYELSQPLALDQWDSVRFDATFDNSPANPVNPNPHTLVTWGDQTWEEMAVAFFEVSCPRTAPTSASSNTRLSASSSDSKPDRVGSAEDFADRFLKALDRNGDQVIGFDEAPLSMQRYSFELFDANRDRRIDRTELVQAYPRAESNR